LLHQPNQLATGLDNITKLPDPENLRLLREMGLPEQKHFCVQKPIFSLPRQWRLVCWHITKLADRENQFLWQIGSRVYHKNRHFGKNVVPIFYTIQIIANIVVKGPSW